MSKFINKTWYQKNILSYILYPFSLIYRVIIFIRHLLYKHHFFKIHQINAPVIVVGNITVGGTGKTPLVIALIHALKKNGFFPGVITRGYGGKSKIWPQMVDYHSDPNLVGDEAVLIAKKSQVPVIAGPNRVDGAKKCITDFHCDVIISDDGLQHTALARDIEIAVIDSTRRLGNGFCLPAGPLREPQSRLRSVDFIVTNGPAKAGEYAMQFVIDDIVSLIDETKKLALSLCDNKKIIAFAGIGNPKRFFDTLQSLNIIFEPKIFPDHYHFQKNDIDVEGADIILMTEKDAVKCRAFADHRHFVVRGHATVDERLMALILKRLNSAPETH